MKINISVQKGNTTVIHGEVDSMEEGTAFMNWTRELDAKAEEAAAVEKKRSRASKGGAANPVPVPEQEALPPVQTTLVPPTPQAPPPVIEMVKDPVTDVYSRKNVNAKVVEMANADPTKLKSVLVAFGQKHGAAEPDKYRFRDVPDDKLQEFMEACAA